MHTEDPEFTKPPENTRLWRFMDFTKFVHMLQSESLYFCRIDQLDDPFEGTFTEATIRDSEKLLDNLLPLPRFAQLREEQKKVETLLFGQFFTRSNFVNCWHMNEYEPYSMWKSYTTTNEAISIQTSLRKFIDSFSETGEDVRIGMVNYLDYRIDHNGGNNLYKKLLTKRKNFEHESELRAIVTYRPSNNILPDPDNPQRNIVNWDAFSNGLNIKAKLDTLIEKIIIAPKAASYFKNAVKSVCEKYNIQKPIENSEIDQTPSTY